MSGITTKFQARNQSLQLRSKACANLKIEAARENEGTIGVPERNAPTRVSRIAKGGTVNIQFKVRIRWLSPMNPHEGAAGRNRVDKLQTNSGWG